MLGPADGKVFFLRFSAAFDAWLLLIGVKMVRPTHQWLTICCPFRFVCLFIRLSAVCLPFLCNCSMFILRFSCGLGQYVASTAAKNICKQIDSKHFPFSRRDVWVKFLKYLSHKVEFHVLTNACFQNNLLHKRTTECRKPLIMQFYEVGLTQKPNEKCEIIQRTFEAFILFIF